MDETRKFILGLFEKFNLKAGSCIRENQFFSALNEANTIVQKYFYDVIQQMIDEDILESRDGHKNGYFLTQKGEDVLINFIREKEAAKNNNNNNISINNNINNSMVNVNSSQTYTQTNSQNNSNTILNIQLILKEHLGEENYKTLEEIIKSSIPQDKKNSKLKAFFGNLSFGVMSNILANLITNLPWG